MNKEKITAYKVSYDGVHYFDTQLPHDPEIGTIIEVVELDWEFYENLPEFQGF